MKISEIMTRDVKTVGPDEDARAVYRKFTDLGIHHIPVVEGEKTVGILSTNDYRGVIHSTGKGTKITADMVFGGLTVRALMTKNPITLHPDASIQSAAAMMLQHEIHGLPVISDGSLMGIITVNDILDAVSRGKIEG